MKFVFGGSGAVAGALIAGSFLLFVPGTVATPIRQSPGSKQQKRPETLKQVIAAPEKSAMKIEEPNPLALPELTTRSTEKIENASEVGKQKQPLQLGKAVDADGARSETITFSATAYSLYGRMASGTHVRKGVIAADRKVLPIGTRVKIEAGNYTGEYEVCDTGGAIRGKRIDVWMPTSHEAMRFGRRNVKLTVLSYPKKTTKACTPSAKAKK